MLKKYKSVLFWSNSHHKCSSSLHECCRVLGLFRFPEKSLCCDVVTWDGSCIKIIIINQRVLKAHFLLPKLLMPDFLGEQMCFQCVIIPVLRVFWTYYQLSVSFNFPIILQGHHSFVNPICSHNCHLFILCYQK